MIYRNLRIEREVLQTGHQKPIAVIAREELLHARQLGQILVRVLVNKTNPLTKIEIKTNK
jgi:hypothetical protein